MSTTLCLDPGTAHTGLAISHEGILAQPLATIYESNITKLAGKLLPFIMQNNPETIVIGTPRHGLLVEYASKIKKELQKNYPGKIILFPEDLSSDSARTLLKQTGKTLTKRKQSEHQAAAAIILQDYLDSL